MSSGFFECPKKVSEKSMKLFMFLGSLILLYIFICMNNKKTIKGGEKDQITFILYYVDWCPHCKTIKPEWEKLEKDTTLKNVVIDRVNCEEDEKAAEENNIEGFPTILFSKNGKVEAYEGGREYGDFKKFLKSKI